MTVVTKETPPEVGVKLKPFIEVTAPFTVTETFCEPAWPPAAATKETELGVATTPLLPPAPIVSVTKTFTEPKIVFSAKVPV